MKDIFDIHRFGKYFASDIRSCAANYGLSMLLISSMGLIIYIGTITMGLIFEHTWDGPDMRFRAVTFAISMLVLAVTMPVKCYGQLTEKRAGTFWLMLPASRLEKTVSMVLMTILVVPVISVLCYCSIDGILCALDSTCGENLFSGMKNLFTDFLNISVATDNDMAAFPALADFCRQVGNPWLYVDDLIGTCLIFLLGAIVFKSGKTAKTIIAYFVFSMAVSTITGPIISDMIPELTGNISVTGEIEFVENLFSKSLFKHVALYDTINDTIVNIALLASIWFRIKTLKH